MPISPMPYIPGVSPGARIHDGTGTFSRASRCAVRIAGEAYMTRVQAAVCSANSVRVAVCSTTSCATAVSLRLLDPSWLTLVLSYFDLKKSEG
jgi:hypothetical protein